MVTEDAAPTPAHPSPERHRTRFGALVLGLAVAPAAWALQSIVGYGLVSAACYPGVAPLATPDVPHLRTILLALNLTALALGLAGHAVAYRSWSATRTEHGGPAAHLLEVGEGRSRFLAMCGRLVSLGFVVAMLFTSLSLLLSPLCR